MRDQIRGDRARRLRELRRPLLVVALAALSVAALLIAYIHLDQANQARADHGGGAPTPCGALHFAAGRLTTATDEATAAEACFARAASQRQAASLAYTIMGVDTGSNDTLVVQPAPSSPSGYTLVDVTSSYSAVIPSGNHTTTYACGSVALTADGLRVTGCQSIGDFTLPATQGAPLAS